MKERGVSREDIAVDELTWRERQVLTLLAERLTNREIGGRLHLAESTVKDYVGNILSKLYVKNRREAVARAKALGLLELEKTAAQPVTNLPAEPTQFVGRKKELQEIKRNLRETRILTLIGPGGIGKSRLALKAAGELLQDFKDGTFLVTLAPIHSPDQIIQTIAEALKFPLATQDDPQVQLLRYLRRRQLLLVIDNFEHLLDGVWIVSDIIQSAPGVTILATSRERLNLQGETILNVGGMAYPDSHDSNEFLDYDAITLFVQSARKVHPSFEPTINDLDKISKICQMVGGMPIAIELAAAWLQILNLAEIAGELEKGLDILVTEMRDAPERHRSIRTIFDHSWSLLNQAEQEVFLNLSVFRGGFTHQAAVQVSGASLQVLMGLVNKSFLNHNPESGRLEVHELLRQYAREQLGKNPQASLALQEAHAAYYGEFMEQIWHDLRCSRQMRALEQVEADIENVRTAWRYILDQKNIPGVRKFIKGLWYLYWIRWWNHAGMELFADAVRALDTAYDQESIVIRALAMAYQSFLMAWLDLAAEGFEIAKESVAVLEQLDQPETLVYAYYSLGLNAYIVYYHSVEVDALNKMVEIVTELSDEWLLAFTLFGQGMAALTQEDFTKARQVAEINLKIYQKIGDRIGTTMPMIVLGYVALARGELERAREYFLQCLTISQETGFYFAMQTASKYLCKVSISLGNLAEAEAYLLQSLKITKEIGFVRDIINLLFETARLQAAQHNFERAIELLALAIEHPASDRYRMLDGRIRDSANELLSKIAHNLPSQTFKQALSRGKALDLDQVVDELLTTHE
jgi:predicted ATPase/DNA-binding CsgD family transcriptional regulator